MTDMTDMAQALQNHPDADVVRAVASGQITPRQGSAVMRRRAKERKTLQPLRHFKSLFSEHHGNRHERRATRVFNRRLSKKNVIAAAAYRERVWERILGSTEGALRFAEGVDVAVAAEWLCQSYRDRQPAPLPVKVAGIVYKASWPENQRDRVRMKVAQRAIKSPGGTPEPVQVTRQRARVSGSR